jgi:putative nucleotidyltransferase with HDIG domain
MERIVILAILLALLVTHFFVVHKVAFLGFYYLPVLVAGYVCGKRTALLLSILAVFLVVLYALVEPERMSPEIPKTREELAKLSPASPQRRNLTDHIRKEKFKLHFSLAAWGGFLVLSAIVSSALYDQKQRRVEELRHAYIGVVEILSKYLELADRPSAGRAMEVARYAAATAAQMSLGEEAVENIRIGALLHDLGHREVSAMILEKSAELGKKADTKIRTHSVSGQEVLRSVGSVLEGVAPIVDAYHEYSVGGWQKPVPGAVMTGAQIIAIARAYRDMLTGSPTRKAKSPTEALAEIRAGAGREFDPAIIEAFDKALQDAEAKNNSREPT